MPFDLGVLNTDTAAVMIALFVALYGLNLGRIELPGYIRNLFNNSIFRVVFLSLLLVFNFNKAPHVAIAVALIFVLTLNYLNQLEVRENFSYLETLKQKVKEQNEKAKTTWAHIINPPKQ